jgi:hypothetical protein
LSNERFVGFDSEIKLRHEQIQDKFFFLFFNNIILYQY